MIRISELIERLQAVQEAADPFDPEVRVMLSMSDVRQVRDVNLDSYVYIDVGTRSVL